MNSLSQRHLVRDSVLGFALWGAVVLTGMGLLLCYSNSAGDAGSPPRVWPVEGRLAAPTGVNKLVMFVHTLCPCSRASMRELSQVVQAVRTDLSVHVVFILPDGIADESREPELWSVAQSVPRAEISTDLGGQLAKRFGVRTSGHVVLYNASGELLFSGGITWSRGHEGDNAGRQMLIRLAQANASGPRQFPVFGCRVFAETGACHSGDDS